MQWILLASVAAALSQASPIADPAPELEARAAGPKLATFDNLAVNQRVLAPYKGLNYTNLIVTDDLNGRLTVAQSKPNFAGTSAQDIPFITIEGTRTKTFDLESFYFGCFDTRSQIATSCNFTVTGRTGTGGRDRYGPFLYSYAPSSDPSASPMLKITENWTGLLNFYINFISDDPSKKLRTWMVLDNVKYTTHE